MRPFFIFLCFLFTAGVASALPSDDQFDTLKSAPSAAHAESVESDILAAFKESGSATADLLLERALLAERAQQFELARELMDRVLLIQPQFSEAWFRRGVLFLSEGQIDQAIQDFNEALTIEPRDFRAWAALGGVFASIEENKHALEAYREALQHHPNYAPALSEVKRLRPIVEGRSI